MEKEYDIDDILSFRSVAELKLQEVLSTSLSSNMEVKGTHSFIEKSQNDERSSSKSRGWLNWISRGMLGAGGTDDSIQFSGIVSDEVVKDIYEATEFQPSVLSSGDVDANYKMFTCAMKFTVGCITATLQSKSYSKKIADLIFDELVIECKLWEELAMVVCHFRSGEMFDPCNKRAILKIGRSLTDGNVREDEPPSCRFQVDMSPKRDIELSVKVMLQPLEVFCHIEFFQSLWELFTVLKSFEFQLERCFFRTHEMVNDAWHLGPNDPFENHRSSSSQLSSENVHEWSYAPYVLQNLTSLPLAYHVFKGLVNTDEFDFSEMKDAKSIQPGSFVPIYLNETLEEQLSRCGPAQSSDRLSEKQSNGAVHHFMSIQLEGMFRPSPPISMDLVGLTYFEVDFTKVLKRTEIDKTGNVSKYDMDLEENARFNTDGGFVVPVVFDVSVQRYTKLIRLYSTVILANATSVPLELRFDIPFGLSPKILDPIYPDQEFPLPLHLAEAGRMRWRPLGNSYLWSEVHDISNILSHESKIGFLKSFVCYPSHPSSDPFRCCISVQSFSLPSSKKLKKGSYNTFKQSVESVDGDQKKSSNRFIHQVTLSAPLAVINYLTDEVSLAIESGGVTRTVLLSEGLTGLLQSPIKEAEKHGLPGVLSGIVFGVAGLVARPAASILEVTGKTAQSIRNRSRLYQMGPQCFRVRLPRPLSRELPLRPYSLEEAVGTSVLMEADVGLNLKNEVLVMCKSLKQAGKFVVVTERLVLTVNSPGLVDLGKPEFRGVPIDPEWLVESEISLDSVIHADAEEEVVHIVGTRSDAELKQNQHQSKKGVLTRTKSWNSPISLPLSLTNLELASMNDAKELLQILLSMIAQGKERRPGSGYVLHRSDIV